MCFDSSCSCLLLNIVSCDVDGCFGSRLCSIGFCDWSDGLRVGGFGVCVMFFLVFDWFVWFVGFCECDGWWFCVRMYLWWGLNI